MKKLNINDKVGVKLTGEGYQRLADHYNKHSKKQAYSPEYFKSFIEDDGYYYENLWIIMEIFASESTILHNLFETDIIIDENDLEDL